jgi:nucleotide-binding universal stress UspA family protein
MQTIVVALDGSSRADGVLASAVSLAEAQRARLVLLRSVGVPAEFPQAFWKATDASLLGTLEADAQEYLTRCEVRVPPSVRGGSCVVVGAPWEAICRAAQTLGADLVVIGSHGYGGIDRLLGTTAAKVVNHCPCSVLVARAATAVGTTPPSPA